MLFAARLNGDKGVHEFVEAARLLKGHSIEATFQVAGARRTVAIYHTMGVL